MRTLILVGLLVSSQIFAAVQGDITMKINTIRAQTNLGSYDVSLGDRVAIYKKSCSGAKVPVCRYDRVGNGVVARVLNDQYSEIVMDRGVPFDEGYVVRPR
ncbi:MAG: hypothetical protein ACM3MG_11105 [Bacillota bacterium]